MLGLGLSLWAIAVKGGGWVLVGGGVPATVDMDFVNNRAHGFGAGLNTPADVLTCTRASTGYAETAAGVLVPFAIDTLRRTDKGLLVEEARTNVVLHNRDLANAAWTVAN